MKVLFVKLTDVVANLALLAGAWVIALALAGAVAHLAVNIVLWGWRHLC